jgi:hypothetical protein
MWVPNRLRMVALLFGLVAGGGSLSGCHRRAAEKAAQPGQPAPDTEALKRSFAGVQKNFSDLQQRSSDLAKQVEAIPPEIPNYPQLRAKFYAFEEARGVTDAKVTLLSGRLDAALKSGKVEELQQVSSEVDRAGEDARQIDQMYLKLLHEVMAFERVADKRKEAAEASSAAPDNAKAKTPKSKR